MREHVQLWKTRRHFCRAGGVPRAFSGLPCHLIVELGETAAGELVRPRLGGALQRRVFQQYGDRSPRMIPFWLPRQDLSCPAHSTACRLFDVTALPWTRENSGRKIRTCCAEDDLPAANRTSPVSAAATTSRRVMRRMRLQDVGFSGAAAFRLRLTKSPSGPINMPRRISRLPRQCIVKRCATSPSRPAGRATTRRRVLSDDHNRRTGSDRYIPRPLCSAASC